MVEDKRSMRKEELKKWLKDIPAEGLYYFGMEPSECEGTIDDKFQEYLELCIEDCGAEATSIDDVSYEIEDHKIIVHIEYSYDNDVPVEQKDVDRFKMSRVKYSDEYYDDIFYDSYDLLSIVKEIVSGFIMHAENELEYQIELGEC